MLDILEQNRRNMKAALQWEKEGMMSLRAPITPLAVMGAALLLWLASISAAEGAILVVNTLEDELNHDGDCSLREAIRAANTDTHVDQCPAGDSGDIVVLPPSVYNLSLIGDFEDQGETGDLDIFSDIVILGSGSRVTSINANGVDRVFDIRAGSTVGLLGLTIQGGSIDGNGGGIQNGGTLIVDSSTIRRNFAFGDGGGIHNSGTLLVRQSTIARNTVFNSGGGIGSAGTLVVVNSTLSGNRIGDEFGADRGGGLRVLPGEAVLLNVTIINNKARTGGAIVNDGGSVRVRNVIVAKSPASANCEGPITSEGHNLESGTTCGFSGPGDLSNTDPQLGPLANNGGPTNTHALLPGSPAIDAAPNDGCPGTDQRGMRRPKDGDGDGTAGCDIGAYERNQHSSN